MNLDAVNRSLGLVQQADIPGLVLPQTNPEDRRQVYRDIESLISPGFLSLTVEVGRSSFTLRSLSHSELTLIRQRTISGQPMDWQLWTIASSVWMVSGYVVIGKRNFARRMYDFVSTWPVPLVGELWSRCLHFFRRQRDALAGVEAYSYEDNSRFLWSSRKGSPLNSPALTGIPGTELVPLNSVQQLWSVLNFYEDRRQKAQQEWSNAKLIASSNSPKQVRKINNRDKMEREREERRRQWVQDRFYYRARGVIQEDDKSEAGHKLTGAVMSTQELEESYRKWCNDEHDWHDKVILLHKQRMQRQHEEDSSKISSRRWEIASHDENPKDLVALTPDEIHRRNRRATGGRPGLRSVGYDQPSDRIYQKYLVGRDFSVEESVEDLAEQISQRRITTRDVPVR